MKLKRINNSKEMLILTGMITDTVFLKKVQSILDTKLFKAKPSKVIAKWCLDYYKENDEAPGIHIQDIYDNYLEDSDGEEHVQIIGKILQNLSKKFERAENFNTDFVLKIAEKHFSSGYMVNKCEQVLDLATTDPKAAAELWESARIPSLPQSKGHDVFKSPGLLKEALEDSRTPLFKMPGALGALINHDLCRESFIGFLGHEKIGKSWILMELAYRASLSRLNVVLIQAGDMSDKQGYRRIAVRCTGKSNLERYCGKQLIPIYDCLHNQENTCRKPFRTGNCGLDMDEEFGDSFLDNVADADMKMDFFRNNNKYKACDACRRHNNKSYRYTYKGAFWYRLRRAIKPLTVGEGITTIRKLDKRTGKKNFKLISYANDTLTVPEIETQLLSWLDQELFVADVIVVDYADILTAPGIAEERPKQNQVWKSLRSLSQKFNCLVITASQADADSYGKHTLNLKNFSEDKRKYGHVTSFYSLNKTDAEKMAGIMRIASLIERDDEFDSRAQVKVLQHLQSGRAHLGSYY